MPPKGSKRARKDGGTNASSSSNKSKKTTRASTANKAKNPITKDQGKAPLSSSSPEEEENPENLDPYEYITICRPYMDIEYENRRKPETEQVSEEELMKQNQCGGGETCMCHKKLEDFPDWTWVIMREAQKRVIDMKIGASYVNSDAFGMYTFNDHEGYGIAETIENLLVQFSKAKEAREQWIIIETLGHWMSYGDIEAFDHIDDGERVCATINLVGTAFLAALHTLDRASLLIHDSEIKDISLMMSLFLELSATYSDAMSITDDQTWPEYIVVLAKEKGIEISGAFNIDETVEENDQDAKLPPVKSGKVGEDRFRFKKMFKEFEKEHGSDAGGRGGPKIGSQHYDITKWTRAQRADAAFEKKDPLPDEIVKGLKEGKQIMLA